MKKDVDRYFSNEIWHAEDKADIPFFTPENMLRLVRLAMPTLDRNEVEEIKPIIKAKKKETTWERYIKLSADDDFVVSKQGKIGHSKRSSIFSEFAMESPRDSIMYVKPVYKP